MYYEPYQKKKTRRQSRRRKRSFGAWLAELCLRLVAFALLAALLTAGALYALPVSLFAVEPEGIDLSLTDGLPSSRINILLLGLDETHENTRRSDTVIIATIGYGSLRLTSVLRDAVMDIPGRGRDKLNAAYAYGGAELVMRTLNQNLGLNLMHYIAADYTALAEAVDALGGVEVPLTEEELTFLNRLIANNAQRLEARGRSSALVTAAGDSVRLNGVQALAYARIRKLDSDFGRTHRQRRLLTALLARLRESLWNIPRLVRLARSLLACADTDLSVVQLLSLGEKALVGGVSDTLRLPVDGTFDDDASALDITDLPANAAAFRAFAYGE